MKEPTQKEIASVYLTEVTSRKNANGNIIGTFKCNYCHVQRNQAIKKGNANLTDHVFAKHPDWKEVVQASVSTLASNKTVSIVQFVDNLSMNVFQWIEWIVMENRELSFCEKALTRKISNLNKICTRTLKSDVPNNGSCSISIHHNDYILRSICIFAYRTIP